MKKIRVVARIDVKNEFAIKGIHLEGLRKVGDPNELALKYYQAGVDEIIFMDAVAAYYDRNNLSEIIKSACKDVFVPITVGGGIRTIEDIQTALNSGADKIAINTKAIRCPEFIQEAASIFGAQCIVVSIEAKKISDGKWEAYIENGREPTGYDVLDWVKEVEKLGAGEILLTSIDADGTKKGYDYDLCREVVRLVSLPVIASGGAGNVKHISKLIEESKVDAVAIASMLHYNIASIKDVKSAMISSDIRVRL